MPLRIQDIKKGESVRIQFRKNADGQRFLNLLYRTGSHMPKDKLVILASIQFGFDREDTWAFHLTEEGYEFEGLDTRGAINIVRS
jgi:hypothetical protein